MNINEVLNLLDNKELNKILIEKKDITTKKKSYKFNIFSITKLGTELENFHSDIIFSLLNPKGAHNEGDKYLKTFLNFLCKEYNSENIKIGDFKEAVVFREKGRLDISILDNHSKKAIIFENKINGAYDMENQLDRYYKWCEDNNFKVVGVVYLSLRGLKKAPPMKKSTDVFNIAAFDNTSKDIVNGWLNCSTGISETLKNAAFIIQYKQLLTFLGYKSMETNLLTEFYNFADSETLKKINNLKKISDEMPEFRRNEFAKKIEGNIQPFTKPYFYEEKKLKRCSYVLAEFREDINNYSLSTIFYKDNSIEISFWINYKSNGTKKISLMEQRLKKIGYFSKFKVFKNSEHSSFFKKFNLENYKTMKGMDQEVLNFVKDFLEKLK